MFKTVQETDKQGRTQIKYFLAQGDSLPIYSKPFRNGEPLDLSLVEHCIFRLSNSDYEQEFKKDLELDVDKFVLRLTSEETKNFSVDTHFYEIEYTLVGGAVQTTNQWKFIITDQII